MTSSFTKPCIFCGKRIFVVSPQTSHTFLYFHGLSLLETYQPHISGLSPEGVSIFACYYPAHIFISRATLLDVVQQYRVHQSITKHNVDSYHALTPMSCDVPMHNAMRCATTCLSHTTYVMNVIWTTQTTQFIMCHGQLY